MHTESLSYGEQRLWSAACDADATPFVDCPVHFSSVARLHGPLNVPALTLAFNRFMGRHDVTRSTYATGDGGRAVRAIAPFVPVELPVTELPGGGDAEIRAALAETVGAPFDLQRGPLLRIRLLKLGEQDHVLAVVAHHIIFDGWSLHVMWRELAAVYDAEANGQPLALPELKASYADYAAWQRKRLDAARLETLGAYWSARLRGARALDLPGDDPRPAPGTRPSAAEPVVLPGELVERLRRFCLDRGMTPGVALAAVFKLLLHSLTGSVDIPVGMPIAERSRPEHEAVAGLFMNLIVLRTDLSNDPTFVELLDRVRQTFIDAYKHRELPFGLVSGPGVDAGAFRVVFNFFVARRAAATLPGLTVRSIDMNDESPSYAELGLHLFDTGDAVHGFVAYDTARFSRERIAAIAGQFNELLSAVLAAPEQRISNYVDMAGTTAGESAA